MSGSVIYCSVCTLPPEYCEFGGTSRQCEDWVMGAHPALHKRLYEEKESLEAGLSALSVKVQERSERDAQKKTAKASALANREHERQATARVVITHSCRGKKKHVITVTGLDEFEPDLHKVSTELGKKLAAGVSAQGKSLVVQGQFSDQIFDFLTDRFKGRAVPVNIVKEEEKKKAKEGDGAEAAAAAAV